VVNQLLAILGAASGPVRELEAPFDPRAPYRLEGRYYGAKVRFCHQGFQRYPAAKAALADEAADAERMGYACEFRLVKHGGEVLETVTTRGRA
jgi:hypothetical protein